TVERRAIRNVHTDPAGAAAHGHVALLHDRRLLRRLNAHTGLARVGQRQKAGHAAERIRDAVLAVHPLLAGRAVPGWGDRTGGSVVVEAATHVGVPDRGVGPGPRAVARQRLADGVGHRIAERVAKDVIAEVWRRR